MVARQWLRSSVFSGPSIDFSFVFEKQSCMIKTATLLFLLSIASIASTNICQDCTAACQTSELLPSSVGGVPKEVFCRTYTSACQACVDSKDKPKSSSCLMAESICLYVASPKLTPDCSRCESACLADPRVPGVINPPANPSLSIQKADFCRNTVAQCVDCATLLPTDDKARFGCNRVMATCLYLGSADL